MTLPDGSTLVTARARRAHFTQAVVHLVPVLHSDREPTRPALCGARSRRYPWVLRPDWPDRPCPLCAERSEQMPESAVPREFPRRVAASAERADAAQSRR